MFGAKLAAAFHERMDGVLLGLGLATVHVLFLAADERLVALYDLALAADGAGSLGRPIASRTRWQRNHAVL